MVALAPLGRNIHGALRCASSRWSELARGLPAVATADDAGSIPPPYPLIPFAPKPALCGQIGAHTVRRSPPVPQVAVFVGGRRRQNGRGHAFGAHIAAGWAASPGSVSPAVKAQPVGSRPRALRPSPHARSPADPLRRRGELCPSSGIPSAVARRPFGARRGRRRAARDRRDQSRLRAGRRGARGLSGTARPPHAPLAVPR